MKTGIKGGICIAAVLLSLAGNAQTASIYSSGGSSATVGLSDGSGMFEWTVGGLDRLVKQWFYYRTGAGGYNTGIEALGLTSWSASGNLLQATYGSSSGVQISVSYEIAGGVNEGDIKENIYIKNNTASAIGGFRFFQYSDFNLSDGPEEVATFEDEFGNIYAASQWNGVDNLTETVALPEASQARADDAQALLNLITTVAGAELETPTQQYYYQGDGAWAFQWTFNLGAGQDMAIIKDKWIRVAPIPEPGTFSLLALAGLLFLRRKSA